MEARLDIQTASTWWGNWYIAKGILNDCNIVIRIYYMAYMFSGMSLHEGIDEFSSLQHVNLKDIQWATIVLLKKA